MCRRHVNEFATDACALKLTIVRFTWNAAAVLLVLILALVVLGYSLVANNPWGMGISWIVAVAAGSLLTLRVLVTRHSADSRL